MSTLIVPGLQGSGPGHWQSWWQETDPQARRIELTDWETPDLPRWTDAVREAVERDSRPTWIVAHSFGCLAAVAASYDCEDRIAGALLVAPADPDRFGTDLIQKFSLIDLPFSSVVVASTNDPWMRFLKAAWLADCWGSRLISFGATGHINEAAGFGPWPGGRDIFRQMVQAYSGYPTGQLRSPITTRQEVSVT